MTDYINTKDSGTIITGTKASNNQSSDKHVKYLQVINLSNKYVSCYWIGSFISQDF